MDKPDSSLSHRSSGATSHTAVKDSDDVKDNHCKHQSGDVESSQWSFLGTISRASYSARARNLDWALFELSEQPQSVSNSPEPTSNLCYIAASPSGDEDVLLYDGSFATGHLSKLPARALLPFADKFVAVHTLDLAEQGGT